MRFPGWGRRAIAFGALAAGVTACTNPSPSLRLIPVIPSDNATISFQKDVQPLFTRSCAKSGCHVAATAPFIFDLNLEEGHAYGNLVGVPSAEVGTLLRVNPGHSDQSYLVHKLEGIGILGSRMPADGLYLPEAEIQVIKDWIDQGALPN